MCNATATTSAGCTSPNFAGATKLLVFYFFSSTFFYSTILRLYYFQVYYFMTLLLLASTVVLFDNSLTLHLFTLPFYSAIFHHAILLLCWSFTLPFFDSAISFVNRKFLNYTATTAAMAAF